MYVSPPKFTCKLAHSILVNQKTGVAKIGKSLNLRPPAQPLFGFLWHWFAKATHARISARSPFVIVPWRITPTPSSRAAHIVPADDVHQQFKTFTSALQIAFHHRAQRQRAEAHNILAVVYFTIEDEASTSGVNKSWGRRRGSLILRKK